MLAHLSPQVPVIRSEDPKATTGLPIRHPFDLPKCVRQLLFPSTLRIDLEVPVVPHHDDVVDIGWIRKGYVRRRRRNSDRIEPILVSGTYP